VSRSEVLNTPIKVLQGIDVAKRVSPVLEHVAQLTGKHRKIPLAQELANAYTDFLKIWPSIQRLTNKAMQKAHFDEFLKQESFPFTLKNQQLIALLCACSQLTS
jgi:hypothetical protein